MKNQIPNLRIGLIENGHHSLKRGYQMWAEWKESNDPWLLKDSIIWVHHGIELVLKRLLVQTNEFLVFDDINKAVERLRILRKTKGMENAGVLELFDRDEKAMSVGFRVLVERVSVTLPIPELAEGAQLRANIDDLTRYRNKVVHFSVELDIVVVSNLLENILEPLLQMLSREVKDNVFKNESIPEIRKIAKPLRDYIKEIRRDISYKATYATINALPPKGNRKAGIVLQAIGTGLGLSVASYVEQVRLNPLMQKTHICIVVDQLTYATQIYETLLNALQVERQVTISFPQRKNALIDALRFEAPSIIVTTIQQINLLEVEVTKECLLVGYGWHAAYKKMCEFFPNSVYILFTHRFPILDSDFLEIFGDIVVEYGVKDLPDAFPSVPIELISIEFLNRLIHDEFGQNFNGRLTQKSLFESDSYVSKLSQYIIQDFEKRQNQWKGKGIIIVPDIKSATTLTRAILEIMPLWSEESDKTDYIRSISGELSSGERVELIERFSKPDDNLSILVVTGSFLNSGIDVPVLNTIYLTSAISKQMLSQLKNLLARPMQGKNSAYVIDFGANDWDLESLQ